MHIGSASSKQFPRTELRIRLIGGSQPIPESINYLHQPDEPRALGKLIASHLGQRIKAHYEENLFNYF